MQTHSHRHTGGYFSPKRHHTKFVFLWLSFLTYHILGHLALSVRGVRSCFFWTAVWYSTISTWYSLFNHSLLMDTFVSLAVNSTTCIVADILVHASLCKSVSISQHTCITELCSPDHWSACICSSLIPNSLTRRCLPVPLMPGLATGLP